MHGETDGSAWTDMTNGRWMHYFTCAFRWLLSCFFASFGQSVRQTYVSIFWCPSEEGHCVTNPPAPSDFHIPTNHSWLLVPWTVPLSPAVARLPDLIGTIPPFHPFVFFFFPMRGTFDPWASPGWRWSHGGCTCLCRCPSGIWNLCT